MAELIEEMTKAGVLLDTGGLRPAEESTRIQQSKGVQTVVDGPFTESKEIIGGYCLLQTRPKRGGGRVGVALPARPRPRMGDGGRGPADRGARLRGGAAGRERSARRARAPLEAAWRIEWPRLVAGLTRVTGDIAAAEELAQDAYWRRWSSGRATACRRTRAAWLMVTAKHRAIDRIRRDAVFRPQAGAARRRPRDRGSRGSSPPGRDRGSGRRARGRPAADDFHGLPPGPSAPAPGPR